MKRLALIALVAAAALAGSAAPGEAWYPWRGGVYVGVGPWYGSGPFYPYGYSYYGPYPYGWGPYGYPVYPPAAVVEPRVYIEQTPPAAPAAPPAPPTPSGFWYYCGSARAYYPDAQTCSEEWVKVPPRSE